MDPKTFADRMRRARLTSPLRTREQALKQFAEVEAFLARHSHLPFAKAPAEAAFQQLRSASNFRVCQRLLPPE